MSRAFCTELCSRMAPGGGQLTSADNRDAFSLGMLDHSLSVLPKKKKTVHKAFADKASLSTPST